MCPESFLVYCSAAEGNCIIHIYLSYMGLNLKSALPPQISDHGKAYNNTSHVTTELGKNGFIVYVCPCLGLCISEDSCLNKGISSLTHCSLRFHLFSLIQQFCSSKQYKNISNNHLFHEQKVTRSPGYHGPLIMATAGQDKM